MRTISVPTEKGKIMAKKDDSLKALSTIERALGMIEGVSCGVDNAAATTLIDAVEMIDHAISELSIS